MKFKSNWSRKALGFLALGLIVPFLLPGAHAALSFSDDFSSSVIPPALEETAPDAFAFGAGAVNVSGTRQYLRTVDADYLSTNFTLDISFIVPASGGGAGCAFVGFGEGMPDENFYGEPQVSIYLRSAPSDFDGGPLRTAISTASGATTENANLGHPGGGSHRVQITKVGDVLVFAMDEDSSGGAFVADYSQTFSLVTDLPFLNTGNSRLFFGSEASGVSFQNIAVTAVPEPSAAAGLGTLAIGTAFVRRRRNVGRGN